MNEKINLFRRVIDEFGKEAYLHPYVDQHELFSNELIENLKNKNIIKVLTYDEIIGNNNEQLYYETLFRDHYTFLNEEEFENDIFADRIANRSMGEIHSLIAAKFLNISIFLSNDNGARFLAQQKINTQNFKITVYSALDVMIMLNKKNIFPKYIRRAFFSEYSSSGWKEKYNEAVHNQQLDE